MAGLQQEVFFELGHSGAALIPKSIPVIGPLDGVLIVVLALRYVARRVPRAVLHEAWPDDPRLLELGDRLARAGSRLIGKGPRVAAGRQTTMIFGDGFEQAMILRTGPYGPIGVCPDCRLVLVMRDETRASLHSREVVDQ